MSILVYAESWEGKFRKNTLEAISYAKQTSNIFQTDVKAVTCGKIDDIELNRLGEFGAKKVISYPNIIKSDGKAVASILQQEVEDAQIIIFSNTFNAKIIASRISSKLKAGLVTNVISYITNSSDICIKKQSTNHLCAKKNRYIFKKNDESELGSVFTFFVLVGIGIKMGVIPDTMVLSGKDLAPYTRAKLVSNDIILESDNIIYFYSEGFLSVIEVGQLLTEDRIVSYETTENNQLEKYQMLYKNIKINK